MQHLRTQHLSARVWSDKSDSPVCYCHFPGSSLYHTATLLLVFWVGAMGRAKSLDERAVRAQMVPASYGVFSGGTDASIVVNHGLILLRLRPPHGHESITLFQHSMALNLCIAMRLKATQVWLHQPPASCRSSSNTETAMFFCLNGASSLPRSPRISGAIFKI